MSRLLGTTLLFLVLAAMPAAWARAPEARRFEVATGIPSAGRATMKRDLEIAMRDLHRIRFDEGSYAMSPRLPPRLRHAARILSRHADVVVYVTGHSDERGAFRENRALALRRAHAVAAYLARFGVDERRIVVVPYGEARPESPRHDAIGWAANRRVELCLVEFDRRLVTPDGRAP